jgi:hypothetical protein
MTVSYRKQVDNYLQELNTDPLGFYKQTWKPKTFVYDYEPVEVSNLSIKELGLQQVIVNTLNHNYHYASGINGSIETGRVALRSATDIWRHIKKYNPEVTIYEVMKCIADNHEDMDLYSHFCCTIDRRVFRISDADDDGNYEDYPREINDYSDDDEFGLTFDEWSEL